MPWKLASLGTVLAAAMLAGCSTATTEPTDPATTTESGHSRCEAKAAEFAIGKQASPQLLEQARTRAGAQNARCYQHAVKGSVSGQAFVTIAIKKFDVVVFFEVVEFFIAFKKFLLPFDGKHLRTQLR